jgi:capsular polysaccharide transport system permease protein
VDKVVDTETQRQLRSRHEEKKRVRVANRWFAWARSHVGFILVVVLPTTFAAIYYGLIAAPVYMSTAQFMIKSATPSPTLSGVGQFLQSAGLTVSPNDAYAVDAYMTSRDALKELEKNNDIRSIYNRPEGDFIARFPNFWLFLYRTAFEYLYWHYWLWTEVDFDSTTNITTIYTYGFRSEDAQTVAEQLLSFGEQAVNRMNERAKVDVLRSLKEEVANLRERAAAIEIKITDFRNKDLILDPNQASTAATNLRATLESALVAARALLSQLQQTAPGSPQIASLRTRIASLEKEVSEQEHKDSGGTNTLAPKIQEYSLLLLEQQFVQQMLQAAVAAQEQAEVLLQQQMLYVDRIAEPLAADWPWYPYRLLDTLLTFVTALLIYGTGRMLNTAVREHIAD